MENSYYNLFLDDIRVPSQITHAWHKGEWGPFPSKLEWATVRSYADFVYFIENSGMPDCISFDHDLSMEHYPKSEEELFLPIDYSNYEEKTGYDCAKWLVEYCMEKGLSLPEFYVHSFNPAGRMNIANYLTRYQETQKDIKSP